ncbi:MAG: hypothetical protein IJ093_00340, partial [Bacilli bacterium]|nr:hypothetical protein [Bacilli bacterium]
MGKDKKHNIKESINEVNSSSENINNISKEKKPLYIGYKTRVFIYTVIFVAALFLATFVINVSFSIKNPQAITYQENGNLDYKVYLKDNEFYEEEYLTKDKTEKAPVFVASLIKKIDITYNYIFKIGAKSNINFNYDIIGTLTIADSNNENVFFEK